MFVGENMRTALAAFARTAGDPEARPERVALSVGKVGGVGKQRLSTGDILAMLIEVGALEDLGLTDRLKSRPFTVPTNADGAVADRLH